MQTSRVHLRRSSAPVVGELFESTSQEQRLHAKRATCLIAALQRYPARLRWIAGHRRSFPRQNHRGHARAASLHVDPPRTPYRRTSTPLRKRRSSISSRSSRTPSAKNRFPLPTATGQTIIWNSSTRPALIACVASSGPSTVMSCWASALSRRAASGSNSRSRTAVDREPCARSPGTPLSRTFSIRTDRCRMRTQARCCRSAPLRLRERPSQNRRARLPCSRPVK